MTLTLDELPDALLIVSFGGPAGPDEVMPFLQRVTGGRVPESRLAEVSDRYATVGGRSPIVDAQNDLVEAVRVHLAAEGPELPVYLATRNWEPNLFDAMTQMRDDGVKRALAFVTSAFSSYAGCRAYLDAIMAAWSEVEGAPRIDKLRGFWNHPLFLETVRMRIEEVLPDAPARLLFTAHSLPVPMADACAYEEQLRAAAALLSADLGGMPWDLCWQSRSGHPSQPWLEPDICDALEGMAGETRAVVVVPLGFVADHMEVVWDLDVEARAKADALGLTMVRARTAGTHPTFVRMVGDLVRERWGADRPTRGRLPALPDVCPAGCCPPGATARPRG